MTPFWLLLWPTLAAAVIGAMARQEHVVWRSVFLLAGLVWITVALLEVACQ
jgi:hypothetical protein